MNKIDNPKTKDEASAAQDKEELQRQLSIGIKKIFTASVVKNVSVSAQDVMVTNLTNDVDKLDDGVQIVMSGMKAKTVTITIDKGANFQLTPSDLINQIKPFAVVSDASVLNVIKLIDSVGYKNKSTVTIEIKNPNVYYAFIVGQRVSYFASSAYYSLASANTPITLNAQKPSSEAVLVKMSNLYEKIGYPVKISLLMKTIQNKPVLVARATKKEGGTNDTVIPMIDDKNWSSPNVLVANSKVPGKVSKRYYLEIDASIGTDGHSIIIRNATITYPEWVLSAVQEKNLNK